jgi:hypothetical protein
MKKPANFLSVLLIAAALGLWAGQQSPPGVKLAGVVEAAVHKPGTMTMR